MFRDESNKKKTSARAHAGNETNTTTTNTTQPRARMKVKKTLINENWLDVTKSVLLENQKNVIVYFDSSTGLSATQTAQCLRMQCVSYQNAWNGVFAHMPAAARDGTLILRFKNTLRTSVEAMERIKQTLLSYEPSSTYKQRKIKGLVGTAGQDDVMYSSNESADASLRSVTTTARRTNPVIVIDDGETEASTTQYQQNENSVVHNTPYALYSQPMNADRYTKPVSSSVNYPDPHVMQPDDGYYEFPYFSDALLQSYQQPVIYPETQGSVLPYAASRVVPIAPARQGGDQQHYFHSTNHLYSELPGRYQPQREFVQEAYNPRSSRTSTSTTTFMTVPMGDLYAEAEGMSHLRKRPRDAEAVSPNKRSKIISSQQTTHGYVGDTVVSAMPQADTRATTPGAPATSAAPTIPATPAAVVENVFVIPQQQAVRAQPDYPEERGDEPALFEDNGFNLMDNNRSVLNDDFSFENDFLLTLFSSSETQCETASAVVAKENATTNAQVENNDLFPDDNHEFYRLY